MRHAHEEKIFALGIVGVAEFAQLLMDPNPLIVVMAAWPMLWRNVRTADATRAVEALVGRDLSASGWEVEYEVQDFLEVARDAEALSAMRRSERAHPPEREPDERSNGTCAGPSETIAQLRARFTAAQWPDSARRLDLVARPCLRIASRRVAQDDLSLGASRIGGVPDVPAGFVWPSNDGFTLAFIAQLDCTTFPTALGEAGFPTSGTLYFFNEWGGDVWGHEPDARGNWLVFYTETPREDLRRTDYPSNLEKHGRFAPCALQTFEAVSYPTESDPRCPSEDFGSWYSASDDPRDDGQSERFHQVGGYARSIQSAVEYDFAISVEPGARAEPPLDLLFAAVSDSASGMMWEDLGALYYLMTGADLAARRFDDVRLILQSF